MIIITELLASREFFSARITLLFTYVRSDAFFSYDISSLYGSLLKRK